MTARSNRLIGNTLDEICRLTSISTQRNGDYENRYFHFK
jgi:hypothetical protein